MKYRSAADFRKALEARLQNQASSEGITDVNHLRRRVAFDRLLARLFYAGKERWVLKGGYALELRYPGLARVTTDLDLNLPPPAAIDLLDEIQSKAQQDLGDHFSFYVSTPIKRAELAGPPLGGRRFRVDARLAGRQFIRFPLDVGQGDLIVGQSEMLPARMDLSFAGLTTPSVTVYPLEDHFAEKLHAYTAPRQIQTRVKDLVDLVLLVEYGLAPSGILKESIDSVYTRYGSHAVPSVLPQPPAAWQEPFSQMAMEVHLPVVDLQEAYELMRTFLARLP